LKPNSAKRLAIAWASLVGLIKADTP